MTECQDDQCNFDGSSKGHDIVLLTTTNCPHCKTMKSLLSEQIKSGKISVIDETNPIFVDKMREKDLDGIPTFLVDDNVCDFTGDNENPKLDCNGEEVIL